MLKLTFFLFSWHFKIFKLYCPGFLLFSSLPPPLKYLQYVISLFMNFCDKPLTWIRICHTSNRCSFGHHVNMFPILCMSNCGCLVMTLSYHTYISFFLSSFPFNAPYTPWLATSYSCTFFTLLVWTYHGWFGYPLALVFV
jgi:hypothetical protein